MASNKLAQKTMDGELQTLRAWATNWISEHYPDDATLSAVTAATVREAMFHDLPTSFTLPRLTNLAEAWWATRFKDMAPSLGLAFLDVEVRVQDDLVERRRELRRFRQMTFDELRMWAVENLRRTNHDRKAVREQVEKWVAEHPDVAIDVDRLMTDFEQLAA